MDRDLEFISDLRTVVTRLIKKLRKKSITGQQFSLTQRSTMALLLQNGSLLPSELAAMEKITNQSMSQILNHLLELGMIVRTDSKTDKRKVMISLSDLGQNTIIKMRSERDEWLTEALKETCTPEEQEILKRAVGPLTKLVDYK